MTQLQLPWVELAILVPLVGALGVGRVRDVYRAAAAAVAFNGVALACAVAAAVNFFLLHAAEAASPLDFFTESFGGRKLFVVDELSALLLPMVALLHFLTAQATARTKMRRFSFAAALFTLAVRMALLGTREPWLIAGLLVLGTIPPYFELRGRGAPTRVYALHMGLFVALLVLGQALMPADGGSGATAASLLLMAAVLVRSGACPVHCWLTDLFEHSTFGTALLYVTPVTGAYLAARLVLPVAPDWALEVMCAVSLFTAVYAAGMATVQRETRRFFAYLFLSHASLILVGMELVCVEEHPVIGLTGSLSLWLSASLSLGGFGLVLRALEGRFGRLSLADYHGLYDHSPTLAVCFLLTGLACVGFPGTLGFVAGELLVDGAVEANRVVGLGDVPWVGLGVVLAAAINGIAVVRAYFLLFTGTRHASSVSLGITRQERLAVLTLAALIVIGGLIPQPGLSSRYRAAQAVLDVRAKTMPECHSSHVGIVHPVAAVE